MRRFSKVRKKSTQKNQPHSYKLTTNGWGKKAISSTENEWTTDDLINNDEYKWVTFLNGV